MHYALFLGCALVKSDHYSFPASAVESRAVWTPENLVMVRQRIDHHGTARACL
jgi:hypothetical protein